MKPKTGICDECGKQGPIIAGKCVYHYWQHRVRVYMGNPKQGVLSDFKPIKKRSKYMARKASRYGRARAYFMLKHEVCEAHIPGCTGKATQVHHKKGRQGELLCDTKYFLAVCYNCHRYIEDHPKFARQKGFSLSRIKK